MVGTGSDLTGTVDLAGIIVVGMAVLVCIISIVVVGFAVLVCVISVAVAGRV